MNVWVLVIEHRHGVDVTVHATEVLANRAIEAYVEEWWSQEKDGVEMPSGPEKIEAYFGDNCDEFYSIDECTVEQEVTANA